MARNYYIFSNGRIRRKENTIYIENEKGEKKAIPIEDVEGIHVFGEVELNTKLLNFLAQQNKPVHFYNFYGFYSGSFLPRDRNVSGELLVKQVEHYIDQERRFYLAYCFVEGALHHMIRNLRGYKNTEPFIQKVEQELLSAKLSSTIPELMSCEGRAKDVYYQAFNVILKDFYFEKRQRRPPTNPINALISFANSLVYSTVLNEIYHTQLNPTISYLHEPREKRFSLCLDLSEIFKPLIADPIIFKLINTEQLGSEDFDEDVNYCYLTESGRKKFIKEFDEKLATTVKHRRLQRKVSYRTIIRIECYKFIKHLLGDEVYKPFKAWW